MIKNPKIIQTDDACESVTLDSVSAESVHMESFSNRLEEIVCDDPQELQVFVNRCEVLSTHCKMIFPLDSQKARLARFLKKVQRAVAANNVWDAGNAGAKLVEVVNDVIHEVRYHYPLN